MFKFRIIKILAPVLVLSILSILIILNLYNRPKVYKELLGSKVVCDFVSFNILENERCYRNAMISIYSGEGNYGIEIIEELCNRGFGDSCYARDQYYRLSNDTGESRRNGNLKTDLDNCIINPVDNKYDNYFCNRLKLSALSINDVSILRLLECKKEKPTCITSKYEDMLISLKLKKALYEDNCNSLKVPNSDFCLKMKEFITNEPLVTDSKSKVTEIAFWLKTICHENLSVCNDLINRISTLELIFRNPQLAQMFPIEHITKESSLRLAAAFLNSPDDVIEKLSNQFLKLYAFYGKGNFQKIKEICLKSSTQEGCVLMFKDLGGLNQHPVEIKDLCKKGDPLACDLNLMSTNGLLSSLSSDKSLGYLLNNKEYLILEDIMSHPTFKIRRFIHIYKYYLIAVILILMFSLQIYVIVLYRRSDDIFAYLRKHQSNEIKEKLKNISKD